MYDMLLTKVDRLAGKTYFVNKKTPKINFGVQLLKLAIGKVGRWVHELILFLGYGQGNQ